MLQLGSGGEAWTLRCRVRPVRFRCTASSAKAIYFCFCVGPRRCRLPMMRRTSLSEGAPRGQWPSPSTALTS